MAEDRHSAENDADLAKRAGDVSQPGGAASDVPAHGNQNTETRDTTVSVEEHKSQQTDSKGG